MEGKEGEVVRHVKICSAYIKKSPAMGESYPTAQSAGTIRPARLTFLKYTDGGRYCQGVWARSVIIGI